MRDNRCSLKEKLMERAFQRRMFLACVLGAMMGGGFLSASTAVAASGVPYVDPSSVGAIGLCDQQDQQLTHGAVDTRPFIWKAVEETAAPAPYNGVGATATLYAYQPRQGVDPSDWSGAQLNIASKFSNPAHPSTAMTGLDHALSVFVAGYPPQWNGFVQLRIYLNAPNQPTYSSTYDSANIKVDENKWSLVGGTTVPCVAGSADSLRQVLATNTAAVASLTAQSTENAAAATAGPAGAGGNPAPTKSGSSAQAAAQPSGATGVAPLPSGSPAVSGSAPQPAVSASQTAPDGGTGGGGSSDTLLWILVGVGVVGAGFVAVQWVRSRS
jgi:hypothetical protein